MWTIFQRLLSSLQLPRLTPLAAESALPEPQHRPPPRALRRLPLAVWPVRATARRRRSVVPAASRTTRCSRRRRLCTSNGSRASCTTTGRSRRRGTARARRWAASRAWWRRRAANPTVSRARCPPPSSSSTPPPRSIAMATSGSSTGRIRWCSGSSAAEWRRWQRHTCTSRRQTTC